MSIRYGIISTAQIVPRFVAGVKESKDGVVAAIASRELTKAKKMADELAIPTAYGSYEELYADETIDVIYVATYNKGHYAAAKAALLAGKHVLVEKPFVLNWDEADELFALATEKNLFLMEAQKAVFLPVTNWVKETIQSGALGEVRYIRTITAYPSVDHIRWFKSLEAGGGAFRGAGAYPLQYVLHVLDTEIAEAAGTAVMQPGESDSQCDVSLLLKNQVQANFFITTQMAQSSELTVFGEKGKIVVPDFWKAESAQLFLGEEIETINRPSSSEFIYEVDHVNDCLAKGLIESPVMKKEVTLQTVELAEQLYQQWTS